MNEKPIIFSTELIPKILDGTKTQTRMVIKPCSKATLHDGSQPEWVYTLAKCPYGQVGDRLIIKETWATENRYNHLKPSEVPRTAKIWYLADEQYDPFIMGIIRPSMFMCKWMSRARPEITEVRVERLQKISEEDCKAEGIAYCTVWVDQNLIAQENSTKRVLFQELWDSLNAKRGYGWESNPFVWCLSFKLIERQVNG